MKLIHDLSLFSPKIRHGLYLVWAITNCTFVVQGGASGQTLGFVDFDFRSSNILSRCCANSAIFASRIGWTAEIVIS